MSKNIKLISKLRPIVILFSLLLILVTAVFFGIHFKAINTFNIIAEYKNTIFEKNPVDMFIAIDFAYNLNFAIHREYLEKTIIIRNMSIEPFVDQHFRGELKNMYEMKKKLFNKASTLPTKLLDVMTTQYIKQNTISLTTL